jgi:hypothetical protein
VAGDGPHPTVRLAGRERPAFRVCGIAGLVAATCLSEALAVGTGLRPGVEAAVIVVAVLTFLGIAELAGLGACLVAALVRRPQARMSSPAHVREIAEALGHAGVATTSQGLRLSGGVAHYTLSQVPPAPAATAAEVVRRLRHPGAGSRLLPGSASALHVVIGSDERA